MENSFLFNIMPLPLRAALLHEGAAAVVQQVLVRGEGGGAHVRRAHDALHGEVVGEGGGGVEAGEHRVERLPAVDEIESGLVAKTF